MTVFHFYPSWYLIKKQRPRTSALPQISSSAAVVESWPPVWSVPPDPAKARASQLAAAALPRSNVAVSTARRPSGSESSPLVPSICSPSTLKNYLAAAGRGVPAPPQMHGLRRKGKCAPALDGDGGGAKPRHLVFGRLPAHLFLLLIGCRPNAACRATHSTTMERSEYKGCRYLFFQGIT